LITTIGSTSYVMH